MASHIAVLKPIGNGQEQLVRIFRFWSFNGAFPDRQVAPAGTCQSIPDPVVPILVLLDFVQPELCPGSRQFK